MIAAAMAKAEKVACGSLDDRCVPLAWTLGYAGTTCTPK
jgi:hypothetical protein